MTFALPVAMSSLVYLAFRNVDYAILGARTAAAQVGFYWRAFQLGVGYQSKISRVMLRISFPVYSRAADVEELRALRMRIVRTHATVIVPLLAAFIAFAPIFVPFVFGSAWEPAVRPAQVLAVAGMADALMTGIGPLMVAIGRPGALLRWNLLVLVGYSIMVFVLAPYGIVAVAVGAAVFGVATVIGVQAMLLQPYAGLGFRQLWLDVRAGIVVAALVLLTATLLREGLEATTLPTVVVLGVLGVATVIAYAAALRMLFPAAWRDLRVIVESRAVGETAFADGGAGSGPPT